MVGRLWVWVWVLGGCADPVAAPPDEGPPVADASAQDAGTTMGQDASVPDVGQPDTPPACVDEDEDGFGEGPCTVGPDCDDSNSAIHPSAVELCDALDNDCDGRADTGIEAAEAIAPLGEAGDIISMELHASGPNLWSGSRSMRSVLEDLRRLVTQELDELSIDASEPDELGRGPRITRGEPCQLLADLTYMLEDFEQSDDVLQAELGPGSGCFTDSFGFQFCTDEPELFVPLPYDRSISHWVFPGVGTVLDDAESPVAQVTITVGGRRHVISAAPLAEPPGATAPEVGAVSSMGVDRLAISDPIMITGSDAEDPPQGLTVRITRQPVGGELQFMGVGDDRGAAPLTVRYQAKGLFSGSDSFEVVLVDGDGHESAPAAFQVEVSELPIVFVDARATGAGDGTSWSNAYGSLQAAVDSAPIGSQVFVAGGRYVSSASDAPVLMLRESIPVYGGFEGLLGALESRAMDRGDPLAEPSILQGDRTGDGQSPDDSQHVVVGATGAIVDGFVVEHGFADGSEQPDAHGGGLLAVDVSDLLVERVIFRDNEAQDRGGAVYASGAAIEFREVRFERNRAVFGGAIESVESTTNITHAVLSQNVTNGNGGAIDSIHATGHYENVLFINNRGHAGGALVSFDRSLSVLQDVSFVDNHAGLEGAAIYSHSSSTTRLTNASFLNNRTDGNGAAMAALFGSRIVGSSITFDGNRADADASGGEGGAIAWTTGGSEVELVSAALFGSSDQPLRVDDPDASTITVRNSCAGFDVSMFGDANVVATQPLLSMDLVGVGSPHALPDGIDERYLSPESACVDAGDSDLADSSGVDWRTMRTTVDGSLDTPPVDSGRHHRVP